MSDFDVKIEEDENGTEIIVHCTRDVLLEFASAGVKSILLDYINESEIESLREENMKLLEQLAEVKEELNFWQRSALKD